MKLVYLQRLLESLYNSCNKQHRETISSSYSLERLGGGIPFYSVNYKQGEDTIRGPNVFSY